MDRLDSEGHVMHTHFRICSVIYFYYERALLFFKLFVSLLRFDACNDVIVSYVRKEPRVEFLRSIVKSAKRQAVRKL